MDNLDTQFEELITRLNKAEARVVELESSNAALKAQANELREVAIMLFNGGWDEAHSLSINGKAKEVFNKTPEQCLNDVKADAITSAANELFDELNISPQSEDMLIHYANKLRGNNEKDT